MGHVLNRALGPVAELQPGEYTTRTGPMLVGKCALRCRQCGGLDTLGEKHTIDGAGRVTPSWRCPTVTCGEVLWLTLESWGRQ